MDTSSEPDALDGLVLAYLERVEAGEAPADALEALCAAHPEQAGALRRGVSLLVETRLHPGPAGDGLPDRVGPFRLLRRLGAGGMGVVYLAEQDAPRRRVALKLVRPDQLWFEGYRDRFRREIESAARMSHPGIAAVFEMGEHDGVPWFSQEFVVGAPLSDLLAGVPARSPETLTGRDLRASLEEALIVAGEEASAWDEEFFRGSWVEVCLRIARQVADALQHAHERGVLHRDVKPSNVLLTPSGRCVLVDFGLASLRGADRLTRTGAQMGSLHYMPPEQVDGRHDEIGPRSDVYSLGVTLYELLTLRAPYASQSVERLRGLILEGGAPEPRRTNPSVSRDASTVCGCAMEHDPARRYAAAAAFSEDLAAVLAHRAIAAQPPGALRRAAHWSRRNPARAVGLVAALLILVVGPAAFGLQQQRAAARLADANADLEREVERREAHYRSAVQAIDRVMDWTADRGLDDVPGMLETRMRVVTEALEVFEALQGERPGDLDVVVRRARLEVTRARILRLVGRGDEAAAALERVASWLEPHADAPDASDDLWFELAGARAQLAALAIAEGDHAAAERSLLRQAELSGRLAARHPQELGHAADRIAAVANLAVEATLLRGADAATLARLDEVVATSGELVEREARSKSLWHVRTLALAARATQRAELGDAHGAMADLELAVEAAERGTQAAPLDWQVRNTFVLTLVRAASTAAMDLRQPERALEWLERARDEQAALAARHPELQAVAESHWVVQASRANALRLAGRRAEGRALLEEIVADGERRVQQGGTEQDAFRLARNLYNLANFAASEDGGDERFEEVLELCDRIDAVLGSALTDPDASHEMRNLREFQLHARGNAWAALGDAAETARDARALDELGLRTPEACFHAAELWAEAFGLDGAGEHRRLAIARLREAVELGFSDLPALVESSLEEHLGGSDEARALFQQVRERHAGR